MQVVLVLASIFALIVAVFAVQNSGSVDLRFLYWEINDVSLVLVILGSVALGALLVFLLGLVKQLNLFRKIRELERNNRQLQERQAELQQIAEQGSSNMVSEVETS